MRSRTDRALVVLSASILLLSACGIPTSQPGGLGDEIELAAEATAELDAYRIAWVADYDLSEEETGRSALQVSGSGLIDAGSGLRPTSVLRRTPSICLSAFAWNSAMPP